MKPEEKAAKMLQFYTELAGDGEASIKTLRETVTGLQSSFKELKGLDPEKILKEFDELKTEQESLKKAFQTSKKGQFYFPGMEDEADKFKVSKYIKGRITGDWTGCEYEKEIVKTSMEAYRKDGGHSMGDDQHGGEFVADQLIADVILPAYRRSKFIALDGEGTTRISVMDRMTGGNVKVPKFKGGVVAYWIGEEDDYVKSQVQTGMITANPKKLGVLVQLTESLMKFGSWGFERLLRRDMAKAIANKIDWTIVFGRGTEDMPRGLAHQPDVQYLSASKYAASAANYLATNKAAASVADFFNGGALNLNLLSETRLALQEKDIDVSDFAHIMSPRALLKMRQRLNANGEDVVLDDNALRALIGDFEETTVLQSNLNAGAGLFTPEDGTNDGKCSLGVHGNFPELILFRWGGLEFLSDNGLGTGFINDTQFIKARMWSDLGNRSEESFVLTPDLLVR